MELAERFHKLFEGLEESHGTFQIQGQEESGKQKGKALTLREQVTSHLWAQHLSGTKSLGIIPINKDSKSKWGCIDVDEYPLDHLALMKKIADAGLPLNVFKSKSGGAHLIVFLSDFIPAPQMSRILKSYCATLKLGKVEIFPKQTQLNAELGHIGNWLNMPYFGGTRCLLAADGTDVLVEQFFDAVKVIDPADVKEHKLKLEDSPIKDGPPCLQTLSLSGFPEGSRNNGLFALGIYCKRAWPEHWRQKLSEFNKELFKPPLELSEVKLVVSQLEKHDYRYRCHDQPINQYCQVALCRSRKHGIGDGALPIVQSVTKYVNHGGDSEWYIETSGTVFSVTSEDLNNRQRFAAKLMNAADIMLPDIKPAQYRAFIQALLDQAKDKPIEMPFTDTVAGQFESHFRDFVHQRANADKSMMQTGKVWIDLRRSRAIFRLKDLVQYLGRRKFTKWSDTRVSNELRSKLGAEIIHPRHEGGRDYAYSVNLSDVGMSDWVEPKQTQGDALG